MSLFSPLSHYLQLTSVEKAMGIWNKTNLISSVFPEQMLEKLANFRNILVFIDMKY